ncbi:hypothetical protein [Leptolyngbya ohadii]|uniref:hypothetical protein n=1 Tax=Leptolyngbya ohadii TaxID=1962290 RepID=UPI0015C66492|nr:hypothetical protein [Leptolyngbya ohadii]
MWAIASRYSKLIACLKMDNDKGNYCEVSSYNQLMTTVSRQVRRAAASRSF